MSFTYVAVADQLANVAIIVRKCPTPVLHKAYITAVRDWCMQTRWLRETVPGATAIGQQTYSLGNDPLLEIIGINAMSVTSMGRTTVVAPSDSGGWPANGVDGVPRAYAYIPEGQFAVWPTPDLVYDMRVTVEVQPTDTATSIPEALLRKYSSTFEAGALAQLLALPKEPWTDPAGAQSQQRMFYAGVSNGKAEVQRNFNTGAQRVRPRAFIV